MLSREARPEYNNYPGWLLDGGVRVPQGDEGPRAIVEDAEHDEDPEEPRMRARAPEDLSQEFAYVDEGRGPRGLGLGVPDWQSFLLLPPAPAIVFRTNRYHSGNTGSPRPGPDLLRNAA